MADRLAGKVALISGAARGQGAAEARLFAREGARVVVGDILDEEGQRVVDDINRGSETRLAVYVHLDVTQVKDWLDAVAAAETEFGGLQILVNNAGITGRTKVVETTEEEWQRVIDIDQKGVWLGMKTALPALERSGGGSIVNIASVAGMIGLGFGVHYQGAKGAVRMMTKSAAIEYATKNIRINAVCPGFIETPMSRTLDPDLKRRFLESYPMKRAAEPEEVAWAVLFLASDEASYITGIDLPVDGGSTAQ